MYQSKPTEPEYFKMQYKYRKPNQALSEYVRTVLILEATAEPVKKELPLYTSGMPALLCRLRKSPAGIEEVLQLTLFGKEVPHDTWDLKKAETIIAYFFNPFLLAVMFNISASQLAKRPAELSNWNAIKTRALKTQLAYTKTTVEKIDTLDNLLLQQLKQQQRECEIIRYATDQIMLNSGLEILSDILKKLSLNERTFQRIFKKYVGVTPNQYRRICQFKLSFEQVKSGKFDKLTDVAYNTGFADQSHFTRSFKEFTEITPKDYVKSGLRKKK